RLMDHLDLFVGRIDYGEGVRLRGAQEDEGRGCLPSRQAQSSLDGRFGKLGPIQWHEHSIELHGCLPSTPAVRSLEPGRLQPRCHGRRRGKSMLSPRGQWCGGSPPPRWDGDASDYRRLSLSKVGGGSSADQLSCSHQKRRPRIILMMSPSVAKDFLNT